MELKDLNELRCLDTENEILNEEIDRLFLTYSDHSTGTFEKAIQDTSKQIVENNNKRQKILDALNSIEDEEVQKMIDLYLRRKTWTQICSIVYGYPSTGACRVRVERALRKISLDTYWM